MKERPTPETDIIAADDNPLFRPWRRRICAHARKLERQRDELMEALQMALAWESNGNTDFDAAWMTKARAAITQVKENP